MTLSAIIEKLEKLQKEEQQTIEQITVARDKLKSIELKRKKLIANLNATFL